MNSSGSSPLPDIFHMYDIRGVYGEDLTDDFIELIGRAAGTFYKRNGADRVVVGRDNRPSGVSLEARFVDGLTSVGCNVVKIGVVTTPMVYFSWHELAAKAACAITASHNPAQYNGVKLTFDKQGLSGDQYQEIKRLIEENDFEEGKASVSEEDLSEKYIRVITRDIKIGRKLKVVVDCGNGTTSLFAPKILKDLGVDLVELYTESDGTFPNHEAYPQKTEFYTKLAGTIKQEKADFGIAYDGDGDRVGMYDENGNFVQNDLVGAVFAREILKENPGRSIVMNVSASQAVIEDVENHGGELVLWKTGYPFIVGKMKETNAVLGGEISGHFFFVDRYFGYDDGIYSSLRFLEIVSNADKTVSQIISDLPKYYTLPEFRVAVPEGSDKFEIVEQVKKAIKEENREIEVLDFDGIRFTFPNKSWGLIRPSNTEPLLSGRAEARTPEELENLKKYMSEKLAVYGVKLEW